jgi:hypothetical protein
MAVAIRSRRLPGVAFDAQPPASARVLPRMDVAAFAGFAAAGPLDVPVVVEDATQFAEIFGDDAPLAWDEGRGEQAYAQLGPAVRAFFRNGGRRAWIVRVAARTALRSVLPVPGLVARGPGGELGHATLRARACGSWADRLRAGTALTSSPALLVAADSETLELTVETGATPIVAGDLLRIPADRHELLVVVSRVRGTATLVDGAAPAPGRIALALACDPATALWIADRDAPLGAAGSARYLDGAGNERAPSATVPHAQRPGRLAIDLAIPVAHAPLAGSLVRVTGLGAPGAPTLWLRADAVENGDGGTVRVGGQPTWSLPAAPDPAPALTVGSAVQRLSFELWVRAGDAERFVLGDLGCSPAHPRYVGDLPTDEELFAARDVPAAPDPVLRGAAAQPRFPLAGNGLDGDRPTYYPLGVGVGVVPETFAGPLAQPGSPLERDGLHSFGDAVFLDRELRRHGTESLADAAEFVRWQAPAPRALTGIHALYDIDEATIACVPDAGHRRWTHAPQATPAQAPLNEDDRLSPPASPPEPAAEFRDCTLHELVPAPVLVLDPPPDQAGGFTLRWTAVDEQGAAYVLQESTDSLGWSRPRTVYAGPRREIRLVGRTSGTYFYRVRATAGPNVSRWSDGVAVETARPRDYVLEDEAHYRPDVMLAVQRALLRMCAARGDMLAVLSAPEHYRGAAAIAHADRLRATSDPAHAQPPPLGLAVVLPLEDGERRALGYGALHHPWLVLSRPDRGEDVRRVAPDGTVSGVISRRARARGAWVAPANEAFEDVVALVQPEPRDALAALQDAQVNELRQEPGGFVCFCEDTLAPDSDVRPINVRRLLSLLRRVALLEGSRYVFEPNDPVFRRGVERGFGEVMQLLYRLGAFTGATPEQAYRVGVGEPPNTAQSIAAGRLIVELRVAPSRPLAFLLVRLRHGAERGLTLETP